MAGTRPFLGTEISLDEIDYTVCIRDRCYRGPQSGEYKMLSINKFLFACRNSTVECQLECELISYMLYMYVCTDCTMTS